MNDDPAGVLWTFTTDASSMWIPRAPVFVGAAGVVIASDGMTVYCLDAQTEVPVWKAVSDRGRIIGGFAVTTAASTSGQLTCGVCHVTGIGGLRCGVVRAARGSHGGGDVAACG